MSILGGATKRFVEEAFVKETDECIIWPFSLDAKGYPQAQDASGFYKPHRRICGMRHGRPPEGAHAAHECGIRSCINKRHLVWANPAQNEEHKFFHGTRRGKRQLTDEEVRNIRERTKNGEFMKDLATEYGMTGTAIAKIVKWRTYRDVA